MFIAINNGRVIVRNQSLSALKADLKDLALKGELGADTTIEITQRIAAVRMVVQVTATEVVPPVT